MKILLFFTFIIGFSFTNFANAGSRDLRTLIKITDRCPKSDWDGNFIISFKVEKEKSEQNWYSADFLEYTIRFASYEDCLGEAQILDGVQSKQVTALCGCEADEHFGAAVSGKEGAYYYSSLGCIRISANSIQKQSNIEYIINHFNELNEKQIESHPFDFFFDHNNPTGRNYQYCKKSVQSEKAKLEK